MWGEGGSKTRRRLKDVKMEVWEEEVEEIACQSCAMYNDKWSTQWSAWKYDNCETMILSNGTSIECGEGGRKTRMRLNMEVWLEEVEEVACQHCSCFNYKELNSPTRKFTYAKTSPTLYCDKDKVGGERDWNGEGWYRITGEAGTKLVDSPAEKSHSGTFAVGWLHGGHPTISMGEVDRTVNFNWLDNTAFRSAPVKVVNCSTFYVYYLPNTPNCHYGYCTE